MFKRVKSLRRSKSTKRAACSKCGKPICHAERRVILGKDWHSACLKCDKCDVMLTPGQHSAYQEKLYCNGCYQLLFGQEQEGFRKGASKAGPDAVNKQSVAETFEALETNQRNPEDLRQQRFDDKLREVTDKINQECKAIIQSLEREHEHTIVQLNKENAFKISTLTEKLGKELYKEQKSTQDVQEDVTKELEKQANRHKEELITTQNDYKPTLAESNQKHQKELTAQHEQARKLELKYQTDLNKERQKRDGYLEEIMVQDQGSLDSFPEEVRRKAKVTMEIEQQDQIQHKIADLQQENDFLRTQVTDQQQRARYLQSELEHQKELYGQLQIQVMAKHQLSSLPNDGDAFQYKQEERAYREQAVGTEDALSDQLRKYMAEAEIEKREKQAVIDKLAETVTEKQQIAKQMTQTESDFELNLGTKLQEIKISREENTQLMAQIEHFRTESSKLQRQLQTAEATYECREAELVQEVDELKDEAAKTQGKVQMAAAMKISLNEQLESVTQDRDSKLKNLEILANEKVFVDDQWTREKNHGASLAQDLAAKEQELSHTKQNYDRTATELQDAHQRLEVSVADTERLHNEVMVAMAQVKQHKKQADSFKAKVEEANAKLLKTQQELQRCQELIKTMEMDYQDQIEQTKAEAISNKLAIEDMDVYRQMMEEKTHQLATLHQELTSWKASNYQIEQVKASAESDKLAAVSDLIQTRKQYILMVEDKTRELETLQRDWEQFNDKQTQRIYELERTLQDLSARQQSSDELVPYCLPRLPALGEQQGSGSYGSVYRIQLNGISCIAKRIHDILLGQGKEKGVNIEDKQAAYQKFYSECVLLSRMRHPSIVQFMGVYYGPQRDYGRELTLVMERLYMNLEDCLEKYKNLDMWLKISILLDVSQGLLHLHSQDIVHRDLTAANILLTTSFHAKIADLGVSKIINVHPLAASKQSMIPGTLGYMPPEALAEIPEYGYALDIFSFGVLILFVLLQEYPQYYENFVTVTGFQRKETQIQKRMKWIAKLSPEDPMRQLICQCLQDEPEQRPTTTELNSNLIPFARHFPKPYVDTIDMQRNLKLTTSPISLPRQLSQGQNLV